MTDEIPVRGPESAKEALLRKCALRKVAVPGLLGESLFVWEMSGDQRDEWERRESEIGKQARLEAGERGADEAEDRARVIGFRSRLVVCCLRDDKGALVFSPDEAELFGGLSTRFVQRCFDAACSLNLVTKEDEAALLGNSGGGPSAASGTA